MKFARAKPVLSVFEIAEKLRDEEYIEEICIRICEQDETEELTYILQSEECGLDRLRVIKGSMDINAKNCVYSILEALIESKKCNICSLSLHGFDGIGDMLFSGGCNLQFIELIYCKIGNEEVNSIADGMSQCRLQHNDRHVIWEPIIEALKTKNCRLRTLKISLKSRRSLRTIAESRGIAEALCSGLCKLKILDLSGSEAGDEVLISLGKTLGSKKCRLKSLYMKKSNIGDEGMNAIVDALRSNHSNLQNLGLSDNKIGDEGAQNLANALENGQCPLQTLDLTSNNLISGKGIKQLKNAIRSGNCRMKSLMLGDHKYRYDYDHDYDYNYDYVDNDNDNVFDLISEAFAEIASSPSTAGSNEGKLPKEIREEDTAYDIAEKEDEFHLSNEGKLPKEIKKEDVPYEEFISVWDCSLPEKNMANLPGKMHFKKVRPKFREKLQHLVRQVYQHDPKNHEVRKQFYLAFAYENCNNAKANPSSYKVNWADFACQALKYSKKRKGKHKESESENIISKKRQDGPN